MHIHVLGICGTFMASIARLAKQLGHDITGCDSEVYPPMNRQLEELGIELVDGYHPKQLQPTPDLIIVGNALSRGNPCIEHMLDNRMPYISGPQWLGDNVLFDRHVLAISGTHGKTTTTAMLTFILNSAGLRPGYLIGGVPIASDSSADLGDSEFFVVEADEYDSAFFDKRSKFLHYHSNTLVINNIEYDHADIFGDLESIKKQFHHLIRTLPESGTVIFPAGNEAIESVLEAGCWSNQSRYGHSAGDWRYHVADQSAKFEILRDMSNVTALETRSLWKIEDAFMSGPFVNFCFVDKTNRRLFVAEGFVYAPSESKRDYMFELETMMRSISVQ